MSEFKDLKITDLVASSTNPRTEFEENSLNELANSIKEHGVLQPIIVRKHPSVSGKFEVVCGERRFRASTIAGTDTIPVSIRELNDDEVFEIQIIENLERKDVHPMDEAIAFSKMLSSGKYTIADIAAKIAKTETFVVQRLKLNDLIEELKNDFISGEFGIGHAVLYARLTPEKQMDIYTDATTGWNQGYGTIKEAKADLENENEDLEDAIFDLGDEYILPAAGSCTSCLKCSSANVVLFPEFEGNFCFDTKCFNIKTENTKISHLIKVLEEKPHILLVSGWSFSSERILDFIKDNGKELLKQYDDYSISGNEGESIEAWHVEDLNFVQIFLKANSKTEILQNSSGANQNLLTEIENIKSRADRALELDREKIYKRTIDELIYNNERNDVLFAGEELKLSEKIALCHSLATYGDDDWIAEELNIDKFEFRRNRLQTISEKYTDQFLYKIIRRYLKSDLVSVSNLDYGKNEDPGAYFNIAKDYFPNEIQLYIDEQNDVAAKRIERSNKRIEDLKKPVKFLVMPRTVVTQEQIEFTKANYLTMSASDIDKKFNTSKGVTRRIIKKYNLFVPKATIDKLRADKNRKPYTKEEDEFIIQNIQSMSTKQIAEKLNRCTSFLSKHCHALGLGEILKKKAMASRFNKGHEPLNKGKRMSEETKEKIKHTFFKKGHLPHNTKDDGSISVRKDKRGIPYIHYRVSLSNWIPLHHKVWIDANGEIPEGHNIIFKNKDTLDVRIENLECLSNAENMIRNTIHRYPPELKFQIRKISKLKRIIKNKSNE